MPTDSGSELFSDWYFSELAACPAWIRNARQGGHRPTVGL